MNKTLETYVETHKKQGCQEIANHSNIKFEDGQSAKFIIDNAERKTVYKIKVDDCLIKDKTTNKCDYIACLKDCREKVFLIELKSNDLSNYDTILKQFTSTVTKIKLDKKNCFCLLVAKNDFPKKGNKRQKVQNQMNKSNLKFSHLIGKQTIKKSYSELLNLIK